MRPQRLLAPLAGLGVFGLSAATSTVLLISLLSTPVSELSALSGMAGLQEQKSADAGNVSSMVLGDRSPEDVFAPFPSDPTSRRSAELTRRPQSSVHHNVPARAGRRTAPEQSAVRAGVVASYPRTVASAWMQRHGHLLGAPELPVRMTEIRRTAAGTVVVFRRLVGGLPLIGGDVPVLVTRSGQVALVNGAPVHVTRAPSSAGPAVARDAAVEIAVLETARST